jgi:transcriptional regulator with XRE-family HTH domain
LSKIDKSMSGNKNQVKAELGQYLRGVRKERNETLHQVSQGTDIDSPMLSKIERGERLPTSEQIKKIAKHFKVPENNLRSKLTAEKILREYGANEVTLDAISIVKEEIVKYVKLKK